MEYKNLILKIIRKPIAIAAVIVLSIILITTAGIKIYFVSSFPEQKLKNFITEFVMDNFRKAVKFDDVTVSLAGNIVLTNFHISTSSDFNDNISLVKSRKVVVRLDFFRALFYGEIYIKGIYFRNPEITLYKKYGRSYLDTFNELFSLTRSFQEIRHIDGGNFRMHADNAVLLYREVFRESILEAGCRNIDVAVIIKDDMLLYSLKGIVNRYKSDVLDDGELFLEGTMRFKHPNILVSSENFIRLTDVDLSYFNLPFGEYYKMPMSMQGGVTAEMSLKSLADNASIEGRIEVNNLNLRYLKPAGSYNVTANENFNADIVCDVLGGGRKIVLRRCVVYDENARINVKGVYRATELEEYFDLQFDTGTVDLANLSGSITPFKDSTCHGIMNVSGRVWFDIKNGFAKDVSCDIGLKNFGIQTSQKGTGRDYIEHLDVNITAKRNRVDAEVFMKKDATDMKFSAKSNVHQWYPLISESTLRGRSKTIDLHNIYYPLRYCVEYFYQGAFDDKQIGYMQVVFKDEPIGKLMNNNNVTLEYKAERLRAGGKAVFPGFSFKAGLNDGQMYLDNLSLTGYEGEYSFGIAARFDSYIPNVQVGGSVKNLNLGALCRDLGIRGTCEGRLHAEMDYSINAFRLAHMLQNSLLNVNVEVTAGLAKGTKLQKELGSFLKKLGVEKPDIEEVTFSKAEFAFTQRADTFTVRRLAVYGDAVQLNGDGEYDFISGLNIPFWMNVKAEKDDGSFSTEKAPCMIGGPFLKPFLTKFSNNTDGNGSHGPALPLFDIN